MANVTVIQPTISCGQAEKIRCAAYCRVSSSSDDQLNSFAVQMTYYSQKFEHSDTEMLVELYADEGISGTGMTKRSEFNRMLVDCRRGKIDRIYTKSISRFARNTRDCLKVVRELKSLGITIKFEKEGFDTAQMSDEIMLTVMGSLAQEESVSISQNMRWSVQKRMQSGTFIASSYPYGYRLKNGKLVIEPTEAIIVKHIFRMYLSGIGIASIAIHMNSPDSPDRSRNWTARSIQYILTNEKYIGDSLFHKYITTETLPFRSVPNRGEKDQFYVADNHEPIISREDFKKVQELLAEHGNKRAVYGKNRLFAKKIQCALCGTTMKFRKCQEISYWTCIKHDALAASCAMKQIPEQNVIAAFLRLYNTLAYRYRDILAPLYRDLQELRIKQYAGSNDAIELHRELSKLLEQSHVLARLRTKGFLDNQKYLEQSNELNAKITKLRAKQKKLYASDAADDAIDQIEMLIEHFAERREPMTAFETDNFAMMVEKITVTKEHDLIFHLIGGLQFTEKASAL